MNEHLNEWFLFVGSVVTALAVSHLCSLLEAALLSITPSQMALLRQQHPHTGKVALKLKQDIEKPIAAILIINTAAHTIGATVAGASLNALFGARYMWLFSLLFTLVMVQYTEILPKTVGVRFNIRILWASARPLAVATVILSPLIRIVRLLNLPFDKRRKDRPTAAEEISALAALARSSQAISSRQERIIRMVPHLSERSAREVMVDAQYISYLDSRQTLEEAIEVSNRDFHTRYPVRDSDDPANVIGYVNFKELVAIARSRKDSLHVGDVIRPISFAEPDDRASELLERFAARHCQIMIIRDPKTRETLGLVTLEDIVEELLGDLDDEFDPLPRTFYSPGEFRYVCGGGVPMAQLKRDTGLDLPCRAEPVSAWLIHTIGRPPRVGDALQFGNAEFQVRKVRRGQVWEFNLKRLKIDGEVHI